MILKIKVIPNAKKNEIHKMNVSQQTNAKGVNALRETSKDKMTELRSNEVKHTTNEINRQHHFSQLKVHLKAAPEKGKANQELISMLASHFNINENKFRIIHGHKSYNKIIEISK